MSEADAPGSAHGVAVTFALPDESRPFVASLGKPLPTYPESQGPRHPEATHLPTVKGQRDGRPVTVVHTGVGDTPAGRARLASTLVSESGPQQQSGEEPQPWKFVIAAGYAGGLAPGLAVGDLVVGENFSDPALLAAARALLADEPLHMGRLTSQSAAAETATAKSALAAETGALAVDMETGWIAEVCRPLNIPLLSLRVISDAADQDFPVPGHVLFDAVRQRPRYVALPAWLLAHPRRIVPFATFVRGLGPARERLTRALQLLVARM